MSRRWSHRAPGLGSGCSMSTSPARSGTRFLRDSTVSLASGIVWPLTRANASWEAARSRRRQSRTVNATASTRAGVTRSRGACALAVVLLVAACDRGGDSAGERQIRDLPADQFALAMSTDIREDGALRARVFGDTVYTWEESARMLLFPLEVELFDEHGAPTGLLTAEQGELDTRTHLMSATGSVVLVSADSTRRILTDELHYDPGRDRIWSDVPTVLLEGESRLEGSGFEASGDLTEVEVFGSTSEGIEVEP
jgi:LPS export ABC transporter protein LptC